MNISTRTEWHEGGMRTPSWHKQSGSRLVCSCVLGLRMARGPHGPRLLRGRPTQRCVCSRHCRSKHELMTLYGLEGLLARITLSECRDDFVVDSAVCVGHLPVFIGEFTAHRMFTVHQLPFGRHLCVPTVGGLLSHRF